VIERTFGRARRKHVDDEPNVKPEHDHLLSLMVGFEDVEQVYNDLKRAMGTMQASGPMAQVIEVGELITCFMDDLCQLRGDFIRYCTKFQDMDWSPRGGLAAPAIVEKPK
jgi:hypothetical protein